MTGACLMTRRDVFERVGGFEEAHDIVNNDVDYCLKVRRLGLLCVYTPHAALIHHERATRHETADHFDKALFAAAWRPAFSRGDPYHPPRLSVDRDEVAVEQEQVQVVGMGRPLFERADIRTILVIKLDHLGDCIGAIPAVRRLKQVFPAARLVMLTAIWATPVWSMVPEIDHLIELDFLSAVPGLPPRVLPPEEIEQLRMRFAAYRFDIAVDLRRFAETRPLLQLAGARYTAGYDFEARFPWLDIGLEWQGDKPGVQKQQNVADGLLLLVEAIAAAAEERVPMLSPTAAAGAERWPAALFERAVVCVHAGVSSAIRQWPPRYFAELIDRLIEDNDVNIALIGGNGDAAATDEVLAALRHPERAWSLVGEIALHELPDFLARCALFLGNNSGPKHIAAALGMPTIGVHSGNVDAREWAPVGPRAVAVRRNVTCSPCYLTRVRDCPRHLACLTELRPMDVYPLCERLLAIGWGRAARNLTPAEAGQSFA